MRVQKYAIYMLLFSINFETVNLFDLGIDYLSSKIAIMILLAISMLNYNLSFSIKSNLKYFFPIILYFSLLTTVSFINKSDNYELVFDLAFLLNILIFFILINVSRRQPNVILEGLFVFAISTSILALLSIAGIGVSESLDELEGRTTIFAINHNMLGINSCISIFVLTLIVIENKLMHGFQRFFPLLMILFLFVLLISTGSRVALISLILGLPVLFKFGKSIFTMKKAILTMVIILAIGLIWQIYLRNTLVADRLFSSLSEGDFSGRDLIWIPIFEIISNNLVWGIGKTGYAKEMSFYIFGSSASPHNVIIEVLCYTGVVGLFLILTFFYKILMNALAKYRNDDDLLSIALIFPLLGMILSAQIFDQKIVWVLFSYMAVSSVNKYRNKKVNYRVKDTLRNPSKIMLNDPPLP